MIVFPENRFLDRTKISHLLHKFEIAINLVTVEILLFQTPVSMLLRYTFVFFIQGPMYLPILENLW